MRTAGGEGRVGRKRGTVKGKWGEAMGRGELVGGGEVDEGRRGGRKKVTRTKSGRGGGAGGRGGD